MDINRIPQWGPSGLVRCTAALLVFGLLVGCAQEPEQNSGMQSMPPEVVLAPVRREAIPIVMEFPGTVKAVKEVAIVPRVSGYIEKRYFEEGTFIKAGDPLYLIDPRPFQARLDARKAQLGRDEATLGFWKKQVARDQRLSKVGAASEQSKEEAISKRNELTARLAQVRAEIRDAELDLGYTKISAPFAGRIEATELYEGDLVAKERDTLTTLVQVDPIYVVFSMSLRQVSTIQELIHKGWAPTTMKKYKAVVSLPTGEEYEMEGHLNYTSVRVNPTTDTHTMRAVFPNPVHANEAIARITLQPGEYVPLRLTVGHQPDALLIPGEALVQSQIGTHVFVVNENNKVENRKVEVDRPHGQQWVIRKGLKEGERVIVEGIQKVRTGMLVKAKTEMPSQQSTSS